MNTALANNEFEKVYTSEEVAEMLKVKPITIRRYILANKLDAFKVGKNWRIYHSELTKFMTSISHK